MRAPNSGSIDGASRARERWDEIASTKFLGSQRKFLLLDTHSLAQT